MPSMDTTTDEGTAPRRKPGPLPGPPTKTYTINIEESDAEWAKQQPGGMAALIRGMLKDARRADEKGNRGKQK